jgi:hypothetical protein
MSIFHFFSGQQFMKITLSMQEQTGGNEEAGAYKNDGVKRILVLAIVKDIPETYDNVLLLLNELDIDCVSYAISSDLKLINIILGKLSRDD